MRFALLTILSLVLFAEPSFAVDKTLDKSRSGGDLTVNNSSNDAFSRPASNLFVDDLRKFTFGNKMFNTNWVTAPASVTSLDGLGPLFNRNSCSGCHTKDGRGRPPVKDEECAANLSILFRLSVLDEKGNAVPHPVYGDQLNPQAVGNVLPEGQVEISYETITEKYPDGTKVKLRNPKYEFVNLNYGSLGDGFMFSPRVAPFVMGLGLLEAIPEKSILANADVHDKNHDGISGRPNYVTDQVAKKQVIGRFGWKANQPSIKQQDAGAALGDMGITTSLNPKENCNPGQDECKKQPHGGNPEMSDFQMDRLNFYVSTLAVPARRDVMDEAALKGEEIFDKISCSSCHTSTFKTGKHKIKALSNQVIHPYSDLLLHDMGDRLADNRPDNQATGKEWRTPPLWGIGLVKIVNRHTNFLHDGRAQNIEEAILWHGGEAEQSKEDFKALPKDQRAQLLKFLESL